MSEPQDMDAPVVTRREMKNAFELWSQAVLDKMDALVSSSERRVLAAMSMLEVRLTSAMHDVEARMMTELASATRASR